MLSEAQKRQLTNHMYNLLRESLFERLFGEESTDEDDAEEIKHRIKHGKKSKEKEDKKIGKKRKEVMDWLKASESDDTTSYSINHADLMRKLWNPDSQEEEDELRSLFSKKLNHALNDNGSEYNFSDEEINTLYNIKGNIV